MTTPEEWTSFVQHYEENFSTLTIQYARDLLSCIPDFKNDNDISVLDIGCGTGVVERVIIDNIERDIIAANFIKITAIDVSPGMIEYCKDFILKYGGELQTESYSTDFCIILKIKRKKSMGITTLEIQGKVMNGQDMSLLPSSNFDLLISNFALVLFPNRQVGMKEALRLLKPNGKLYMNGWDTTPEVMKGYGIMDCVKHLFNNFPNQAERVSLRIDKGNKTGNNGDPFEPDVRLKTSLLSLGFVNVVNFSTYHSLTFLTFDDFWMFLCYFSPTVSVPISKLNENQLLKAKDAMRKLLAVKVDADKPIVLHNRIQSLIAQRSE